MLKVLLKHIMYDAGISAFFDNLIKSFSINLYGKWASNPEAFKKDHPIGSVIYIDFTFLVIDIFNENKNNLKLNINNYPGVITGHLPIGVDNKLRLTAKTDLTYINDLIIVYDVITETWTHDGGIFRKYLNSNVWNKLGYNVH